MVEWAVWKSEFSCGTREGAGGEERELFEREYKLKGSRFKTAKEGQKEPEMKSGVMVQSTAQSLCRVNEHWASRLGLPAQATWLHPCTPKPTSAWPEPVPFFHRETMDSSLG